MKEPLQTEPAPVVDGPFQKAQLEFLRRGKTPSAWATENGFSTQAVNRAIHGKGLGPKGFHIKERIRQWLAITPPLVKEEVQPDRAPL